MNKKIIYYTLAAILYFGVLILPVFGDQILPMSSMISSLLIIGSLLLFLLGIFAKKEGESRTVGLFDKKNIFYALSMLSLWYAGMEFWYAQESGYTHNASNSKIFIYLILGITFVIIGIFSKKEFQVSSITEKLHLNPKLNAFWIIAIIIIWILAGLYLKF